LTVDWAVLLELLAADVVEVVAVAVAVAVAAVAAHLCPVADSAVVVAAVADDAASACLLVFADAAAAVAAGLLLPVAEVGCVVAAVVADAADVVAEVAIALKNLVDPGAVADAVVLDVAWWGMKQSQCRCWAGESCQKKDQGE
jgi:hypothetical protein